MGAAKRWCNMISKSKTLPDELGQERAFCAQQAANLPFFLERERIVSAKQSAELCGVSIATWRRMYWAGKTPQAVRVSDRRLGWRVKDLLEHLANRGEVAA
jgi:predicted DNA-binding transcriptional regulator AlpA